MTAIIFALIAAIGWGTADVFGGLVARKIGGYSSALWSFLISLALSTLYIPFAWHELSGITPTSIVWLIILTPISVIPLISLYEGFKVGNPSLIGTIAGANGGLVAILSVLFLGETLSSYQVLAIIAIVLGLLISSLDLKTINTKNILSDKGIPYALLSFFAWGIYYTFVKIPIDNIGWFWPAYISYLGFPLVFLFMHIKSIKFETPKTGKIITFTFINSVLLTIALFAFNFALTSGQNSIVSPVSSTYPALFAVIAYFVFKDRLSKQQILGIIITLAGVIALSVVS